MTYLLTFAGFVLLLLGGEAIVRGSVALAGRLGVSPLVVGVTVVGFGTSLPEMVVCVNAALAGAPGLAVGNVVGSNIANTMLVLGVAALILPIAVNPKAVRYDALGMFFVTLVFVAIGATGGLAWWHGALLLTALCVYVGVTFWHDDRTNDDAAELHREEAAERGTIPLHIAGLFCIVVSGLVAVVVGAEWLVTGATQMARSFGVPEEVIGLTLVAVGTSLPELATAVVAAYRGHSDVCVGNVLGSNVFNLFGIAGVTALFAPLPFSSKIVEFDLWVLLASAVVLLPFMLTGFRISRVEGAVLAALYCAFVAAQFTGLNGLLSGV